MEKKTVTDTYVGKSFRLEIANATTFFIVLVLNHIESLKGN